MVLDTTVMNVSVSQVVSDLGTTLTQLQLAITLYTLVMGSFILLGGRLGDTYGRRRVFGIGLLVYGVGSLITAFSPNIGVLVFGWSFVEGAGAVLVIPAIISLIAANYDGKDRAVAYSALGGITAAGAAAGPLIGGWVTEAFTWRVVFFSETVICIVILAGIRLISDDAKPQRTAIDWGGTVLSALGMGLIVLALVKAGSWGFIKPSGAPEIAGKTITPFGFSVVPFMIAAGILILYGFVGWENRVIARGGTVGMAVFGAGFGLVASQLGNVIMSSIGERERGEAGGMQGTAQNIGASVGIALLGALLVTALSSGFNNAVQSDPTISPQTKTQVAHATADGVQTLAKDQLEAVGAQHQIPANEMSALVTDYLDAQLSAIKAAILLAIFLACLGLIIARRLPRIPAAQL